MQTDRKHFLPLQNCFELFGFDFLPRDDGSLALLEINGGPALEGVAMPQLCAQVIEDTLTVGPFSRSKQRLLFDSVPLPFPQYPFLYLACFDGSSWGCCATHCVRLTEVVFVLSFCLGLIPLPLSACLGPTSSPPGEAACQRSFAGPGVPEGGFFL